MYECEGYLHLSGGSNSFGHLLKDYWTYHVKDNDGNWQELKSQLPTKKKVNLLQLNRASNSLLERANHTMCTVKSGEGYLTGLSGRLKVTKFTSYIFGGFVMSSSGQF